MNAGPDTTDIAAHAVGIGAADEPKGQTMTLIERLEKAGEGSRETLVTRLLSGERSNALDVLIEVALFVPDETTFDAVTITVLR